MMFQGNFEPHITMEHVQVSGLHCVLCRRLLEAGEDVAAGTITLEIQKY
jgi:hypothetical protein